MVFEYRSPLLAALNNAMRGWMYRSCDPDCSACEPQACAWQVEELCSCAVKEEQVEMKLGAVIAQWGATDFTFGDFKTHGAVILKPSETAEVVTALEEGQMLLGGMASNRYAAPFRSAFHPVDGTRACGFPSACS